MLADQDRREVIRLVTAGVRAGLQTARQGSVLPQTLWIPGTVGAFGASGASVLVRLDPDVNAIKAINMAGCSVTVGQRVLVRVQPDQGAFITDVISGGVGMPQVVADERCDGTLTSYAYDVPQTGSILVVDVWGAIATASGLLVRPNGDSTAANYFRDGIYKKFGVAAANISDSTPAGMYLGDSMTELSRAAFARVEIPLYASETFRKTGHVFCRWTTGNAGVTAPYWEGAVEWASSAAITSVTVTNSGGFVFNAGSRIRVTVIP